MDRAGAAALSIELKQTIDELGLSAYIRIEGSFRSSSRGEGGLERPAAAADCCSG